MDGESISPSSKSKGFWPRTREELLALDLAKALNDLGGLAFYLSCARRYPESLLRRLLGEVRETPPEKIKKSRAALFNYLLKKYAQAASKNSGGQPGDKISGDSLP